MLYRHVIPSTGTKGWGVTVGLSVLVARRAHLTDTFKAQLFGELMRDKPSMTRANEVFGSLPDVLMEHIKAQYSTYPRLNSLFRISMSV